MKRYLYLWHRWLGIALCLFMALWFVSGMVMLYVGYPKLTPAEHLGRLPLLSPATCCVAPEQALAATGREAPVQRLRLTSLGGVPHYLLVYGDGITLAVNAGNGRLVERVDAEAALASARQFGAGAAAHYLGSVQEDVWSHSRALDGDRPLHVVQLADGEERRLYISSRTGAVVRDATASERLWNWLGAWLHWLYPLRGGALDGWWTDIVIYLSVAAIVVAVLGIVVGLLRWRFRRPYRSGSRSPYAGGFARWHHLSGLLFGALLVAWIFSGLMSMRPWQLLQSRSELQAADYQGGELRPDRFPVGPAQALARFRQSGIEVREMEWRRIAGQGYLVAYDVAGASRIWPMRDGAEPLVRLPNAELQLAAAALLPGGAASHEWLEGYDFHYYARAEQSMYGYQTRRLPILRTRFDDPVATWAHIDPYTGELIELIDENRRFGRSLFNLLHSWDWLPLLERPRLREALMLALSLGGLLISLSGVVLGWRRLRGKRRAPRRHVRSSASVR